MKIIIRPAPYPAGFFFTKMKQMATEQIYENYTKEDFRVWKTLFNRQMKFLERKVCDDYLKALDRVQFKPDKIPDFQEVNLLLEKQTGWGLINVPGLSSQEDFFRNLDRRRFTATSWLRSQKQLDYIEEPDMFHDVFAHTPLLSDPDYCKFFRNLGALAVKYLNHPEMLLQLGRIYWYTIEFGMITSSGGPQIYGAGIISSPGESRNALADHSAKKDFDVKEILQTGYKTDRIQDCYFVIDSFDQLSDALPEIESCLV